MTTRTARRWLARAAIAMSLMYVFASASFAQSVWNGSVSNNWFTAGNWSSNVVPNSTTTNVLISSPTNNPVVMSGKATIENLTLMNSSVTLDITGVAEGLGIAGNSISNAGVIEINGAAGMFIDNPNVTLSGTGTINLGLSTGGSAVIEAGAAGTDILTNESTIQGEGSIGGNGLSVINAGTIDANLSGQALVVSTVGSSAVITNYMNVGQLQVLGLLEATSGGTLNLEATVDNANADIVSNDGVVQLIGATIRGGTLTTLNLGTMGSAVQSSATLDGSTVSGAVTISAGSIYSIYNASTTNVLGTLTNNGAIEVYGGTQFGATFAISGNVTLNGGGVINLSTFGSGPALVGANATGLTLTNVDNTIQGAGIIGNNGMTLINHGIIDANTPFSAATMSNTGSTGVLILSAATTNFDGLLEGTNGGTLQIQSVVNNTAGVIAGNGGSVALSGGTIQGGTIKTSGTGMVGSIIGGGTLDGSTGAGVVTISNNSTYTVNNASTTTLVGEIFNVGTIQIDGGNDNSGVLFTGNSNNASVTLEGGGTVNMTSATGGGTAVISEQNHTTQTLVNVDNTIQGAGTIGNTNLTLFNGGTIDANTSSGTGILFVNAQVTNSNGEDGGLLEATNGGTLQLQTTVKNDNGNITADGGAVQFLTGTVIQAGTLNTMNGGTMVGVSGNITLDGSTNAGPIDISEGSTYTSAIGTNTYIVGQIANEGTIQIDGGNGSFGTLNINTDEVEVAGGGTIILSTAPGAREAIIQAVAADETLTNDDNTIEGAGLIGNGGLALNNGGIIDANVSGQTLTLNGQGGVVNANLLEGTDGGTLLIQAQIDNSDGDITADGGIVSVDSLIAGGTLNSLNGGTLETTTGGVAVLNGVTISGGSVYLSGNNTQTQILRTITNSGAIEIAAGTASASLELNDDATLTGGGIVTLSESGAAAATITEAFQVSGSTLTSDNTIQGGGIIGNSDLTFENDATVDANATGKTLTLNGSGGVTNTGLLEATNGGTLQISTGIDNAGANITANGGTVSIDSDIAGGILNSENGGTLETTPNGVAGLKDVTISNGTTYINGNNSQLQVEGTIINGGAIRITAAVNNSLMVLTDDTTLEGGGTVTLSSTPSEGTAFIQGNGNTLTNVDNAIQGVGTIGNGTLQMVNGGTIDANVAPTALTTGVLLLNAQTTNSNGAEPGLLEATNGGILKIQTTVDNFNGFITAAGGSVQMVNGTDIEGGTLTTTAGGTMSTFSGNITLDGSTNSGAIIITPGSTYTASNGTGTFMAGTITNFGAIHVNGGAGTNGFLIADGDVTLNGAGTVTLTTAPSTGNPIIEQSAAGGATLTNVNNLIQGAGSIGSNGLDVVNQSAGTILANAAGQTLTLNGGTVENDGTMRVNAGSTMTVTSTLTNFNGNTLTGGTYIVNGASGTGNTGTMRLSSLGNIAAGEIVNNAASITLNGPTASTLLIDAGGNAALKPLVANSTASSSFTVEGGYAFTTIGNFSNAGAVNIGAGSAFTTGASGGSGYTQAGGTTATTSVAGTLTAATASINAGTLLGTGTVVSPNSTIAAAGHLMPGTSTTNPGTLGFTGALTVNGTLNEVLTNAGFGVTTISGNLALNAGSSILDIMQAANYDPSVGTTLIIMTAGTPVTGTFGTIDNAMFDGGAEAWDVLYNQGGNNVELVAAAVAATPVTAVWNDGSGNWTTAADWSCTPGVTTCVPNNTATSLYSVTLNSAADTLTLDNTQTPSAITITNLTVTAGTIAINGGASITVLGTTNNSGTININASTMNAGALTNSGTITESGTNASLIADLTNSGAMNLNGAGDTMTDSGPFNNNSGGSLNFNAANSSSAPAISTVSGNFTNSTGAALNFNSGSAYSGLTVSGTFSNSGGTVTMTGSHDVLTSTGLFTNSGNVGVGATETLNANGGYTNGGAGSTDISGALNTTTYQHTSGTTTVEAGGNISATAFNQSGGLVQGTGTVGGNYMQTGGTIAPGLGATPGALSITGNYSQGSAGTMDIDLGGTGAGEFSVLDVAGNVGLNGTVDFTAIDGFDPTIGDDFTFLLFGSDTGSADFSNIVFTNWTCPVDATCTDVFSANSLSLDIAAATVGPPPPPPVAEPSALPMLGIGLVALGVLYIRKTRKHSSPA